MRRAPMLAVGIVLGLLSGPALACDLCPRQTAPLSWEVARAPVVVFGTFTKAELALDGRGGKSEFRIDAVIKGADVLKNQSSIILPRYVPPDPKAQTKFLILIDIRNRQFDPYLDVTVTTDHVVRYLQHAPPYDPKAKPEDRAGRLPYYFKFLDDADPAVSLDAYKEFASASNAEVGLIAGKLSPDNLRKWLLDKNTPDYRLSLYGFLLGACGNDRDAELLRSLVLNPDARLGRALDGLLAGYIHLRPKDGWKLSLDILGDAKREFTHRYAILRMLRFYHGYQPEASREQVLKGISLLLKQEDMIDLAIEQLRTWRLWDLTETVLALYGKKETNYPITKRALVRYALVCPRPEAQRFVVTVRQKEPELVKDVEEALRFETSP